MMATDRKEKKKQIRILKRYYLITPMAMDLLCVCVCVTEEGDRKGRIILLFQFTEAPLPTHPLTPPNTPDP